MSIKTRITLIFTVVVTSILLAVCLSIYYFSDLTREKDFKRRLRNRAHTTVNLLVKVEGIDNNLMRRIEETTVMTLQDKSIVLYSDNNKEEYTYADPGATIVRVDKSILDDARRSGEQFIDQDGKEALVLAFTDYNKRYTVVISAFDRSGLEKISQLRLILIISFFSGSLIIFITGLIFSARIVAPIKKIITDVKEISSQNLSGRIHVSEPRDELGQLSDTFNDLLTRLQESFEIQTRFIANASHELSTPLTSMSSQLEITLQNERTAKEYKTIISSVYEDVKNLTQLTRSLLEIAKASGTSSGMELSLVRIDELLMKLPPLIRKTDRSYLVNMHFDTFPENEDELLVFGNSDLLYSAIKNIALNACKFASDHTADISLNFTEGHLHVIIRNLGSVIPEKDRKMIFQPFYRSSDANETAGSGLGLSLASRIIKMHKGEIDVHSTETDGTTFSIHLPLAKEFYNT